MNMQPQGIMAKMQCAIVNEDSYNPIPCIMFYAATNPFEVVFTPGDLSTPEGEFVEWHYGRDLLKAALDGEDKQIHGEGDVIVSKEEHFIFTLLQSSEGRALVAFAEDDMRTFLNLTADLVPFGEEQMEEDIDAALREILGD